MISWINYIVESSLVLAILLLFYRMILSKEKCINYNRYYLLAAAIASILLPLISLPFSALDDSPEIYSTVFEIPAIISQVTTFNEVSASGNNALLEAITFIYFIGFTIGLIALFIKLYKLVRLIRSSEIIQNNSKFKVVLTNGKLPSFSFHNYLFLNQLNKTEQEIDSIIKHESAHISQKHSIDVLMVEFYKIFFWFNPLSYQLAKAVRLNHEYLADNAVLRSSDRKTYIQTLVNQVYHNTVSNMVHYFGLHSTEKRIQMMGKSVNFASLYRPYFSIPFFSILFFTFSCHFEPVEVLPSTIGQGTTPIEFQNAMEELKLKNPERSYFFKLTSNLSLEKIKELDYGSYSIDYSAPLKNYSGESYGLIYSFAKARELPEEVFSNHVYQVHEISQIPIPWVGYEKLLISIDKYANQQIHVSENKTIWVKFVLTTIGQITYTNITDENYSSMTTEEAEQYGAAINAINSTSNQWRIGSINNNVVNVELELPVRLYKD